jgi:diadenosine tetraphosphate (Ap4A) HIT family hydrolase
MNDLSEENIRLNCPHCDQNSDAYTYKLETTQFFNVVCDYHPLLEGHLLIIPKEHLSCVAEYSEPTYQDFIALYQKYFGFVQAEYGAVSTFEHGKFGQSVFHSHVHLLPTDGEPTDVVPEGREHLSPNDYES